MEKYNQVSYLLSQKLTNSYSTSFSLATRLFPKHIRPSIYSIYGFVRLCDEVVDIPSVKSKRFLLEDIYHELTRSQQNHFSTNLIINSFRLTADKYNINDDLIVAFLDSMKYDINFHTPNPLEYEQYIYGSAEVVGLMCLKIFCGGDSDLYNKASSAARSLGSAFQKINFLRDLRDDNQNLNRYYFPVGNYDNFDETTKKEIIKNIKKDLSVGLTGINLLPSNIRPAIRASYLYYQQLLIKIEHSSITKLKNERIRINNFTKLLLLLRAKYGLRMRY